MNKKEIQEYLKKTTLTNSVQIVGDLIQPGNSHGFNVGKYFLIDVRKFSKVRSNMVAWVDASEAYVGTKIDIISYLASQDRDRLPISSKSTPDSPIYQIFINGRIGQSHLTGYKIGKQ